MCKAKITNREGQDVEAYQRNPAAANQAAVILLTALGNEPPRPPGGPDRLHSEVLAVIDLARVFIGQRTVPADIGVNLGRQGQRQLPIVRAMSPSSETSSDPDCPLRIPSTMSGASNVRRRIRPT